MKLLLTLFIFIASIAFAGGSGYIYGYGETQERAIATALEYVKTDDCLIKEISISQNQESLQFKATVSVYGCRVNEDDRP
jgi:hypothetical protein